MTVLARRRDVLLRILDLYRSVSASSLQRVTRYRHVLSRNVTQVRPHQGRHGRSFRRLPPLQAINHREETALVGYRREGEGHEDQEQDAGNQNHERPHKREDHEGRAGHRVTLERVHQVERVGEERAA